MITMMHLRRSSLPLPLSRAFVLLLAVGAIIAGILAMHTLSSAPAHADTAPTAMSDEAHLISPAATVTAPQPCDDSCDFSHTMTMVGCILALLTGVLIVGAALRGSPVLLTMRPRAVWSATARQSSFYGLAPPDLHVLSISRI